MVACLLVLTGCAASSRGQAPSPGPPVFVDATCPVAAGVDLATRGRIPDDFRTAWVLRCRGEDRVEPGGGRVVAQVSERADTSATELVRRLREPSDPPYTGDACPASLTVPPYFVLVDESGRAILPAVPTNGCGQPRPEATAPLADLPWRRLSSVDVGQVQSEKSVTTGCGDAWKNLIDRDPPPEPGPAEAVWPTAVSRLRVCVYDVRGETGTLVSGHTVAARDATRIAEALDRAGPARDCPAKHTRFAVLLNPSRAEWAVAELDGCRRLLRPDNTLGQLDDATIAMITR